MPPALKVTRNVSVSTLLKRKNQERNPKVRDRLQLLILVKQGFTAGEAARLVGMSPATAGRWIKRFNRWGHEGLYNRRAPGGKRKVDYDDLKRALLRSPRDVGYDEDAWYPALVRRYIQEHQGVTIGERYVYELLARLGFSLVVPRPRHHRQDPTKAREFRKIVNTLAAELQRKKK